MFKFFIFISIIAIALDAKDLLCLKKVTMNIDTKAVYEFTKEEAKKDYVVITEKSDKILVKLPSGNVYEHKYYKTTADFKYFIDLVSNTNFRKSINDANWIMDAKIKGEMHSTMFICVEM